MGQNLAVARASADDTTIGVRHSGLDETSRPASPAPPKTATEVNLANGFALVTLPDELLCQIAVYLAPSQRVGKDEGYGLKHKTTEVDASENARLRQRYASSMQDLLQFGLTCSRFARISRDILYRNVSLLQPYRAPLPNERPTSPLRCFLRTIIERPELATLVQKLAVWIWKSNPIHASIDSFNKSCCACTTCMKTLGGLVDNLNLSLLEEEGGWLKDLPDPTEATICGLIFAALPNLHTVELYAKPLPEEKTKPNPAVPHLVICRNNDKKSTGELYPSDVLRLSQGLAVTHITSLTLSSNLNGLHKARLPSLKTLELDYSDANQFVTVGKGCFSNVATLKIQSEREFDYGAIRLFTLNKRESLIQKLNILFKGLPSVRTLEFQCSAIAQLCAIPDYVETMKFRMAGAGALDWIQHRLDLRCSGNTAPKNLKLVEVHWDEDPLYDIEESNLPRLSVWQRLLKGRGIRDLRNFDAVDEESGIRVVVTGCDWDSA